METAAMTVQVSERALFERIKRRLAKEGERLHLCRYNSRWFSTLGRYYAVDMYTSFVTGSCYDLEDLETLGREIGAQDWEVLEA